ncbi:MAG: D-alanyl-D-alanine carboxypeptidase [Peptococcaceae bacterium]|jgi:D-alanyl-D-alanine carboxypeptidase (penicillin-binding protein 5/6)|nr:D-alanyl-D-alanine carboxypeptidase [Peptococcaceae bacterium]
MSTRTTLFTVLAAVIIFLPWGRTADALPEVTGEAAVLMDSRNGQFIYEKNASQRMYPASTTKILTAIIALESGKLNDMVTISAGSCNVEGSAIGLQEGEKISMVDLLYAMMLNSGNDAAMAIATHIAGSIEGFAELMNKKAAAIGAVNSHFNNPSGLPDPNHFTTAQDMALIALYAMQNPEFRKIVATHTQTIKRADPLAQTYLENSNRLLWNYEGTIGVKTGYTNDAGQCLVSAANRHGRELLAVVMKAEGNNIWSDSMALLDYGFNGFINVCLTEAGKPAGEIEVYYGESESVPVQTGCSLYYNFPKYQEVALRTEVQQAAIIKAPVKEGAKLGELVYFSGDYELGRVDLLAQKQVERKFLTKIWPWVIVVLLLAVLVLLVRKHNMARRRRWHKYRQRNRLPYENM